MLETESTPKPESTAVVLLTLYQNWYPNGIRSIGDTDKIRGDLALESIQAGTDHGYRVVVADGGSSTAFRNELLEFSQITFIQRQEKARAAGRRQAFIAAAALDGVKYILRTEPEKVSVIGEFVPQIINPLTKNAQIVIPKRNPYLFKSTYPDYMWESEVAANMEYNSLLQENGLLPVDEFLDICFGPVAFSNDSNILQLFLEKYQLSPTSSQSTLEYANLEENSNGFLFPLVKALSQGLSVASPEVAFRYPDIQRLNEETVEKQALDRFKLKRQRQRFGFIEELKEFLAYLRRDPETRIRLLNF